MSRRIPRVLTAAIVALLAAPATYAELPALIPRDVLFPRSAAMRSPQLSPDGSLLSYIAPDGAGVSQLWVRDLETSSRRRLTSAQAPGIASHTWAENSRCILYQRPTDTGPRISSINKGNTPIPLSCFHRQFLIDYC